MRSLHAFINLQGKESDLYLSRSIQTNTITDAAPYTWGVQRQDGRGTFNGVHWFSQAMTHCCMGLWNVPVNMILKDLTEPHLIVAGMLRQ